LTSFNARRRTPPVAERESSDELVVKGKIDLDALVMVIAGSVAGGP
jgi:hypothetical protein